MAPLVIVIVALPDPLPLQPPVAVIATAGIGAELMQNDAERNLVRESHTDECIQVTNARDSSGSAELAAWGVQKNIGPAVEGMQGGERSFESAAFIGTEDFVAGGPIEWFDGGTELEVVIFGFVFEGVVRVIGLPGEFGAIIDGYLFVDRDVAIDEAAVGRG